MYIGVDNTARKVTDIALGVNNRAKRVLEGYIGVDGLARKFYQYELDSPWFLQNGSASNYYAIGGDPNNFLIAGASKLLHGTNITGPYTEVLTNDLIMNSVARRGSIFYIGSDNHAAIVESNSSLTSFTQRNFSNRETDKLKVKILNNNLIAFGGSSTSGQPGSFANTLIVSYIDNNWHTYGVNGVQEAYDAAYGEGVYVVVGHGIFVSSNAVSWTRYEISGANFFNSVVYNPNYGYFVASSGNNIYNSTDGVNWEYQRGLSSRVTTMTLDSYGLVYAGTYEGRIFRTTDGTNWVEEANLNNMIISLKANWTSVVASTLDNQLYFKRVGDGGETITRLSNLKANDFLFTGGNWAIAVGDNELVAVTSNHGNNWSKQTGNGVVVSARYLETNKGIYSCYACSSDGTAIRKQNMAANLNLKKFPYKLNYVGNFVNTPLYIGDGGFMATVPNDADNTENWTTQIISTENLRHSSMAGANLVFVGDNGAVVSAPNESGPFMETKYGTSNFHKVAFNNEYGVIVGDGVTMESTNTGATWTIQTAVNLSNIYFTDVVYYYDLWVAVGYNKSNNAGVVYTRSRTFSSNWTQRVNNAGTPFESVATDGGVAIAVGRGATYRSTNGTTWSNANNNNNYRQIIAMNNPGQFMAVGDNGLVSTTNASNIWTHETVTTGDDLYCAVIIGPNFITVGGENNNVHSRNI